MGREREIGGEYVKLLVVRNGGPDSRGLLGEWPNASAFSLVDLVMHLDILRALVLALEVVVVVVAAFVARRRGVRDSRAARQKLVLETSAILRVPFFFLLSLTIVFVAPTRLPLIDLHPDDYSGRSGETRIFKSFKLTR